MTPVGSETEHSIHLVGTGTYVTAHKRCQIITCEHVAEVQPMHFRFCGADDVFETRTPWVQAPMPVDAAIWELPQAAWESVLHKAAAVPIERFAPAHAPTTKEEIFFLYGFAGENSHQAFGVHETGGSGYAAQIQDGGIDPETFELFWDPDKTTYTDSTDEESRAAIKFDDPHGLSGSLVWNTRYVEAMQARVPWTPEFAVVTGLLRRWDPVARTLLVWRVEHLLKWLAAQVAP